MPPGRKDLMAETRLPAKPFAAAASELLGCLSGPSSVVTSKPELSGAVPYS